MRTGTAHSLLLAIFVGLLATTSCGGTWVDDRKNFDRVFGFEQPRDVTVIHSYYWKSSHWSTEYRYFIAIRPSTKFVEGLTDPRVAVPVTPDDKLLDSCADKRPGWFVPKPLANYEAWKPKTDDRYRIVRDRADGTLFVCDERL